MIEIWEPRYRDRSVLIAAYKVPDRGDVDVEITRGYYKGKYRIDGDTVRSARSEQMDTKKGGTVEVKIVGLDKLERRQ